MVINQKTHGKGHNAGVADGSDAYKVALSEAYRLE